MGPPLTSTPENGHYRERAYSFPILPKSERLPQRFDVSSPAPESELARGPSGPGIHSVRVATMTPTALQNAVIGTVVVLVAVLAAACLLGARKASRANAKKLAKLRELDGQRVRLGLRTVGRDFLLEHTAVLKVGEGVDTVSLEANQVWSVPVAQVRWVADPKTGQRLAGPW